jgi:hypothetical protein
MNNALTKIIENLSKNANVKRFLSDFDRLSQDLKKLQTNLNQKLNVEKEQALKKAKSEYAKIVTRVRTAEKDLNKEVKTAITKIKKSADQVEKNLNTYKKKATQQQAKAAKMLKAKSTTKKTAPKARRTTKKAAKKA